MTSLSVSDLIQAIGALRRDRLYAYVSGQNQLQIDSIDNMSGAIRFSRRSRAGKLTPGTISPQMLARAAAIFAAKPDYPLHIDRMFSAGGNSRSALETLLAYTPHFYVCYPERFDSYSGEIRRDLKHLIWSPGEAGHAPGILVEKTYQGVINEQEAALEFGEIHIPKGERRSEFDTIEAQRVHVQMQVALIRIGSALGLQSWIARNDHTARVGQMRLIDLDGTIPSLDQVKLFFDPEIRRAAEMIDCIWFTRDGRAVPAIIEIEHSTGVTSGLTRMLKFQQVFPGINPVFTIVAPDEMRSKVLREISDRAFSGLNARFLAYSRVRELYGLLQRYTLSGLLDHRFAIAFMETVNK
jgi:type II restriction enzyme